MKTTIKTDRKQITILANKEKLIGLAIGYNKEYKTIGIVLPFFVIEIRTKLLTDVAESNVGSNKVKNL